MRYIESVDDIRARSAKYYDLNPTVPEDVEFYRSLIRSPRSHLLELGCGTGRVLLPLAESCAYIHGIDLSPAMISICQAKLVEASIPPARAQAEVQDISNFDLGRKSDLIIAPYRAFQNLETDVAVEGLFHCVRRHLSADATCVLNVFNPNRDAETLRREWCRPEERFAWEVAVEGGRVTCHERFARMDRERLILYPELIYRRYQDDVLVDETVLKIAMRVYYPDQFAELILRHGFEIMSRWGGYTGEPYGTGPELIIQFRDRLKSSR